MNVLFLIPPSPGNRRIIRLIECSHEAKADYLWQPYDYLAISSLLSPRDGAALIDGTADRLDEADYFARMEGERPDLVFCALSSACWDWDLRLFRAVRERFPATPVYLVGDIFLEDDYLSFILPECEGVVFLPHLLDLEAMARDARRGNTSLPGLRKPSGPSAESRKSLRFVRAGIPRHELFLKDGYLFPFARHGRFATVTTTWGCPFSCFYCNQRGIPPVAREGGEVVDELAALDALGVRELFFADKAFGFPARTVEPLLDAMRDRFRFSWSCYFHPMMYRPELLGKMRAAGCHTLIIGLESADFAGLAQYGRRVDPARVEALLSHADRLGIDVCADFIVGLEHESEADIRRTIDLALRLPIDFASFNVAAPLPGSGIRQRASEAGKMTFGREGFDTRAAGGVLAETTVPRERIMELRDEAVHRFYTRPGYLWRRFRRTSSLEHLRIQLRQAAGLFRRR
jgi:radical SAM superfamily enzyme YgiQ (UPF0313 family)